MTILEALLPEFKVGRSSFLYNDSTIISDSLSLRCPRIFKSLKCMLFLHMSE